MALVNTLSKIIISCYFICWISFGFCGDLRRNLKEEKVHQKTELLRQQLVDTAKYFLFVREATGNNDGKWVEKFQKETGNKKGDAWCASFVVSCHNFVGIPIVQSGWSPSLFTSNVVWQYQDWRKGFIPKSGQVFGIFYDSKQRVAHVGIIESSNGKVVNSIEGNTNGAGSREGDGVYRKIRYMESIWIISDYVGSQELLMEWRKKGVHTKLELINQSK